MLLNPGCECFTFKITWGKTENDFFCRINIHLKFVAIKPKEKFRSCITNTFISINKRMIEDKRKHESALSKLTLIVEEVHGF
jgi:hypothetical protein